MDEGLDTLCNPLSGEEEELARELSQLPRRLMKLVPHIVIGAVAVALTGTAWGMLCGVGTLVTHIKVRNHMSH